MSDVLAPSLFDAMPADVLAQVPGPVHRLDPATSHEAALANAPRSGSQRHRVLEALDAAGANGLTDHEAAQRCHLARPHIAGTRRAELVKLALVERTGDRRRTDTGCTALVWRITEAGRKVAAQLREAERAGQTASKGDVDDAR